MSAAQEEAVEAAIAAGRSDALVLLKERAEFHRVRAEAAGESIAALEAKPREVLVAEGDSWFDYPLRNVLTVLEDDHGYEVESVAHSGDRVEDMAYTGGQLSGLLRVLEKVQRNQRPVRAILLSGGGNDVAGSEFQMLLDHARSPKPGLNESVVSGVVDQRVRSALVTIVSAATELCREKFGKPVPILVHGYDYAVADGRGFLGGWGPLPGPWLEPGFRQKGYESLQDRKVIVREMIDRFNDMLESVAAHPEFQHVNYVDLRETLSSGADYKDWWADELHPSRRGFVEVARRIAQRL